MDRNARPLGPITFDADTEVLYEAQFGQIEDGRDAMGRAGSKEVLAGFRMVVRLHSDRVND